MTKEELKGKVNKLKEEKKELIKLKSKYRSSGNIYYSITNLLRTNLMIDTVDKKISSYDFYNFDEEYISYILYLINEIENYDVPDEEYIEEEYRFVEFSNEGIITTYKNKNNDVVSIIAKNKDIELLKIKYFDDIYMNENSKYSKHIQKLFNYNDGFIVNTRKDDEKLVINSNMFNNHFSYVSEFLERLVNYRLMSEKKQLDLNIIASVMDDIILKYHEINKVLKKH